MVQKRGNITEEFVSAYTIQSLKENPKGVISYPVLEFDDRALDLLSTGIAETLKYATIKPAGGKLYFLVK